MAQGSDEHDGVSCRAGLRLMTSAFGGYKVLESAVDDIMLHYRGSQGRGCSGPKGANAGTASVAV